MNHETRDERLRRILREADGARGEPDLTTAEVRAMRRAVLTAIPEARPRFALVPALAGVLMVVLTVLAILARWPYLDPSPASPREPTRLATKAPAPPAVPVLAPPVEPVAAAVVQRTSHRAARKHRAAPALVHDRIAAANSSTEPSDEEEIRTRQIQFSTPGGTRVIWILTADKAL